MPIDWSRVAVRLNRSAGTYRWPPGVRRDPLCKTRWTDHDLWFVLDGKGAMRVGDEVFRIDPGRCLWLRPARTYDYWQDPGQRLSYNFVHFDLLGSRGRVLDNR